MHCGACDVAGFTDENEVSHNHIIAKKCYNGCYEANFFPETPTFKRYP